MANSPTPAAPGHSGFSSIQVLRGFAAWLVVCRHVGEAIELRTGGWPLPQFTRGGYMGVDIFFCLSGFIMYVTAEDSFGRTGEWSRFLVRRFLRIYPAYWIVSAAALVLGLVGIKLFDSHVGSIAHIIKSFLLLPQSTSPVLGPGWTLVHEVRFYVTFGLALMLPKRWALWCFAAWGVGSLAVLLISYTGTAWFDATLLGRATNYFFHPSSLEFVLGILVAWIVRNLRTSLPFDRWVLACGLAGTFCTLQWLEALKPATKYFAITLFAGPSFLLVLGSALAERRWRPTFAPFTLLLGDASYSTYLTHILSLSAFLTLFALIHSGATALVFPAWGAWLVVLGVHLVGVAFYRCFEGPLHERARQWSKRLTSRQAE